MTKLQFDVLNELEKTNSQVYNLKSNMINPEKYLLPIDGSSERLSAISFATKIPPKNRQFIPTYLIRVPRIYPYNHELPEQNEIGEQVLNFVEEEFKNEGHNDIQSEVLQGRDVGDMTVEFARMINASHIIIGVKNKIGEDLGYDPEARYVIREAENQTVILFRQSLEENNSNTKKTTEAKNYIRLDRNKYKK